MEIKPLLTEEQIQQRVRELASAINRDFADHEAVVVGVLKGSFIFMADLIRHFTIPITCDFLRMQSYDSEGKPSGVVRLEFDLTQPVEDKNVLLVEDIVDTGLTAATLIEHIKGKQPRSVKLCALLHKPVKKTHAPIDYLGFEIPNKYVVGYGMDLDGKYRDLPYIGQVNGLGDT